jgi:D-alanine-D-alanine ligase
MIARDKALSKMILHHHRIRVPRFAVVPAGRKLTRKPARLDYPLIVKSQVAEASFGIAEASIVYNDEKLAERVDFMHAKVGTNLILEQYVDGRELYVGIMGNARLQVLPVWELEMRSSAWMRRGSRQGRLSGTRNSRSGEASSSALRVTCRRRWSGSSSKRPNACIACCS